MYFLTGVFVLSAFFICIDYYWANIDDTIRTRAIDNCLLGSSVD